MRRRGDDKPRKRWDVFIPPEPPEKPVRSGGRPKPGLNGRTDARPARALPPLQPIIDRRKERAAVKRWNVAHGPTETMEKFYVDGSDKVGVCLIRETPDSPHPIVYVTSHPAELRGAALAWCVGCQSKDCAGCIWALKSFRARQRGAYGDDEFSQWNAAVTADDRLPF